MIPKNKIIIGDAVRSSIIDMYRQCIALTIPETSPISMRLNHPTENSTEMEAGRI